MPGGKELGSDELRNDGSRRPLQQGRGPVDVKGKHWRGPVKLHPRIVNFAVGAQLAAIALHPALATKFVAPIARRKVAKNKEVGIAPDHPLCALTQQTSHGQEPSKVRAHHRLVGETLVNGRGHIIKQRIIEEVVRKALTMRPVLNRLATTPQPANKPFGTMGLEYNGVRQLTFLKKTGPKFECRNATTWTKPPRYNALLQLFIRDHS